MSDHSKTVGGPFTQDEAFGELTSIIGQWQLRGYGRWMVADRASDAPLGVVGIYHPGDWPEREIGWTVFKEAEGKGIAHEAALAARAYAYQHLGWDRIVSCVAPTNTRSAKLAQRMGCVKESTFHNDDLGTLDVWRHEAPDVAPHPQIDIHIPREQAA